MMALLLFLLTTAISFIGSLQAGLVNTAVLARTLRSGKGAGNSMALGGALPELFYAGLAFTAGSAADEMLGRHAFLIAMIGGSLLIGLGTYFMLFFDPSQARRSNKARNGAFSTGVLLGLMNPQLLVFWCAVWLALRAAGWRLESTLDLLAYSLGAFTGAWILLFSLVVLGQRSQLWIGPTTMRLVFRFVGVVLVALGSYTILR